MDSGSRFLSMDDTHLYPKWFIDPKLLFVGPRIGEGAHAKAYEGKYKNQNVAIKIVHKSDTPEEVAKREGRFMREVSMHANVQHKNLVKFIGACKEPVMVVVTELLLGGSLRKYMLNMRLRSLESRVALGFALDIARTMEFLHSHGIIHRVLKPGLMSNYVPLNMVLLFIQNGRRWKTKRKKIWRKRRESEDENESAVHLDLFPLHDSIPIH